MTTQFENMTEEEQKAWWLEQAKNALKHYNMADADVSWLAYTHNAVFNVYSKTFDMRRKADQNHYVLRLQSDATRNEEDLNNELLFMDMILIHSGVRIPNVKQAKQGHLYVKLKVDDMSLYATLFEALEGSEVSADKVTNQQMSKIGENLAWLHRMSAETLTLTGKPQERIGRKLDYNGLLGETGLYHLSEEAMQVFTDEQLTVMDAVAEKVKAAMDELGTDENEFGLIHGDLLLQNILFHEGEVRALDFEYCGWGYYLYDLTPLLWQLKPQARYPELEQALWDGYTSIRPLSSRHRELLETFIAGRQVASMRWVAANRHNPSYQGKVEGIMVQRAAELQGFLDTGILRRK